MRRLGRVVRIILVGGLVPFLWVGVWLACLYEAFTGRPLWDTDERNEMW